MVGLYYSLKKIKITAPVDILENGGKRQFKLKVRFNLKAPRWKPYSKMADNANSNLKLVRTNFKSTVLVAILDSANSNLKLNYNKIKNGALLKWRTIKLI